MIILPRFMETDPHYRLLRMDDCSCVMHRQAIGQERIQVLLTKNLLVFILQGKKIIHTDSGDLSIEAGGAFFAQKGAYLLSEKQNTESGFQSLMFFIDDRFIKEFSESSKELLLQTDERKPVSRQIYAIGAGSLLTQCITSFISYFDTEVPNKTELLKTKFRELFYHLINADPEHHFLHYLKHTLLCSKTDLHVFMNENFTLPLSVAGFARQTSRSLSSFKLEFKKAFGIPPGKWITGKRLERARALLASTDRNVTEVCFDAGFDNVSHFIQLFRKEFGTTPKQLKRVQ